MSYETDKVLVLAGTGSNYIAATHYESHPNSSRKEKAIHLSVRKHEHEVAGFGAPPTENGYGVFLDKDRWLQLRAHCDALFANDEATGRNNIEVKLKVDASRARDAFRDAKESTQDGRLDSLEASIESLKESLKKRIDLVLDDVDDVHDTQGTVIRGLERRVESLQDKVLTLDKKAPLPAYVSSHLLEKLQTAVNVLQITAGELDGRIVGTEDRLTDLSSDTLGIGDMLEALHGQVQAIRDWVINLQGDQSKLKEGLRKAAGGFDF